MKKFIALCIFSIGLFLALPQMSSGSGTAPPDQVSFVADIQQAAPALDVQAMSIVEAPVLFVESTPVNPVLLCDLVVQQSPNFKMFYRLNYRTCLSLQVQGQNLQGILSDLQCIFRIRNDTSV